LPILRHADDASPEAPCAIHPQAPAPIEGINQENLALPTIPGPRGGCPSRSRSLLFGARLLAIAKRGGGVRPIACGGLFSRWAAKALLRQQKERASAIFWGSEEFGVGRPFGRAHAPRPGKKIFSTMSYMQLYYTSNYHTHVALLSRRDHDI
jgi:hypothetical protein